MSDSPTLDREDEGARWKRYLFAVLTGVAYNTGTLFTSSWGLTDEEKDEIVSEYRKRGHETSS